MSINVKFLLLLQMNANGYLSTRNHIVIAPFMDSIQTGIKYNMNHHYVMHPCPDLLHQVTNLIIDSRDDFDFSPTSIFIATWFEVSQSGRSPHLVSSMYTHRHLAHVKGTHNYNIDLTHQVHNSGLHT